MLLIERLKLVGLNTSEIEVYLWVLKKHLVKPGDVSRETKISRTNCYNVLRLLETKGLVRKEQSAGSTFYRANHPRELSAYLNKQKAIADDLMAELNQSAVWRPSLQSTTWTASKRNSLHYKLRGQSRFMVGPTMPLNHRSRYLMDSSRARDR